ncbi:hypothetical protein ACS0TY_017790 [Phlomoides rotata]
MKKTFQNLPSLCPISAPSKLCKQLSFTEFSGESVRVCPAASGQPDPMAVPAPYQARLCDHVLQHFCDISLEIEEYVSSNRGQLAMALAQTYSGTPASSIDDVDPLLHLLVTTAISHKLTPREALANPVATSQGIAPVNPVGPLPTGIATPRLVEHFEGDDSMDSDRNSGPITGLATTAPVPDKSYAQAVKVDVSTQISTEHLQGMKPVRKGMYLTVAIDEVLYKKRVLELRDSLIGRITHARGNKPLGQADLTKKLVTIWGIQNPWSMIPMGEGYYNFQFSCGDDSSSIAQVWIRISELPLEYWNPNIITALASAVGMVIKLDDRTASRSMGHFARVLVELDLNHDREEFVMFERAGHRSAVYIQYERLPDFCNYCSIIGHTIGNCHTSHNPYRGKSKIVLSDSKVALKPDHPAGDSSSGDQQAFEAESDQRNPSSLVNLADSSAGEHQTSQRQSCWTVTTG